MSAQLSTQNRNVAVSRRRNRKQTASSHQCIQLLAALRFNIHNNLPDSPSVLARHEEKLFQTSNRAQASSSKRPQKEERKVEAQVPPQARSQATGRGGGGQWHGRAHVRRTDVESGEEGDGPRAT